MYFAGVQRQCRRRMHAPNVRELSRLDRRNFFGDLKTESNSLEKARMALKA
jgi:hypothetical protein